MLTVKITNRLLEILSNIYSSAQKIVLLYFIAMDQIEQTQDLQAFYYENNQVNGNHANPKKLPPLDNPPSQADTNLGLNGTKAIIIY